MKIKLAYGESGIEIAVPDSAVLVEPRHVQAIADENARAVNALRNPIGKPPLNSMVRSGDRVAIVISDITRPTPNHKLVPWILDELSRVPAKNFTVIVGTGSHRDNTRDELIAMLGRNVVEKMRVVNNNAFDRKTQASIGRTKDGIEVFLNREYVESDFKIITGFIEPHFFAGFSGGPKGIMPGLAAIENIQDFHSARLIGNPDSNWGIVDGNPVQQLATEIALMSKPDFLFNVALNTSKEITAFFTGDVIAAHREGCRYVKERAMVKCPHAFDIVITTNSGYPLDQNLYQAVKGISAVQRIVRKGGAIICAAECRDGLPDHGNYAKILRMAGSPQALLDIINDPSFRIYDQWQVQKQAMAQIWADVYLFSSLSRKVCEDAMLKYTASIEKTLQDLLKKMGPSATVAVMPAGPMTIPYVAA